MLPNLSLHNITFIGEFGDLIVNMLDPFLEFPDPLRAFGIAEGWAGLAVWGQRIPLMRMVL